MGIPVGEVVRDLERRRTQALVAGDIEAAAPLHAEEYELITPGGAAVSKQAYLEDIATGALRYRAFEAASEPEVRVLGSGAVIRYRARIEVEFPDGRDGGVFWHTDVYERADGRWQAVWSQATRTEDPV